ncbi:juvenile hormone esterase-like [Prorops nasuta]|uniref:juvenile hormone esterase-like n=1 Tax=Prorops nasuta TaxID=863751 RepID=UPI0034CD9E4E
MADRRFVDVKVSQGTLRGFVEENVLGGEHFSFKGIAYAKPPIGPLRFKDPLPPDSWFGVKDALEYGGKCAHNDFIFNESVGGDDCLYLNVHTNDLKPSKKRAVMIWIHGGAFLYGSGNNDMYGPDFFVKKDVILVTINYRLGILGFLNLEHEEAPGNQGLKDQVMALKWVKENVENFGGDSNNITIFGESAGAASVHYLCLSPLADGLFHKAIAQSGVVINPWAFVYDPKRFALEVTAKLGETSTDPKKMVEFLRTVDTKVLINTQTKLLSDKKNMQLQVMFPFGPGMDIKSPNPFFPKPLTEAARAGVKVPLMLGYNSDEGIFLLTSVKENDFEYFNNNLKDVLHPWILEKLKQQGVSIDEFRRIYFGDNPLKKENATELLKVYFDDAYFVQGIHEAADIQLETSKNPTYLYKFSYDNGNSLLKKAFGVNFPGTCHGDELFFLFNANMARALDIPPPQPGTTDRQVSECLLTMWTNFAKTGNPTPTTNELIPITWQPLKKGEFCNYLNINKELRNETIRKGEQKWEWRSMKNKL